MTAVTNSAAGETDRPETELLVFNGINGATGGYLIPPMAPATLAAIATGIRPEEEWGAGQLDELKYRHDLATQPNFAPISGVDPTKLDQTGWGVIFPAALDPNLLAALKEALGELLALRRSHAGDLYREYSGGEGYRAGESKDDLLTRHGSGPGVVDPARFPYYVLLAGDPESIPYRFQYEMDVAHAVGHLSFETLDEYAQYARSVVAAETDQVTLPRRAGFIAGARAHRASSPGTCLRLPSAHADAVRQQHDHERIETHATGNCLVIQLLVQGRRQAHQEPPARMTWTW